MTRGTVHSIVIPAAKPTLKKCTLLFVKPFRTFIGRKFYFKISNSLFELGVFFLKIRKFLFECSKL